MNIFFTASIRGGRQQQPKYAQIISQLEKYGTVSSRHVSSVVLSEYGETALTGKEVLERELNALEASDIVVAEVTTPSLGVGYLIARASVLGKRIVALYEGSDVLMLSSIVKGDPRVEIHSYRTLDEIEQILARVFENTTLPAAA